MKIRIALFFLLVTPTLLMAENSYLISRDSAAADGVVISSRLQDDEKQFCFGNYVVRVRLPVLFKGEPFKRAMLQIYASDGVTMQVGAFTSETISKKDQIMCIAKDMLPNAYVVADYGEHLCISQTTLSVKLDQFIAEELSI